jgi:hypothetical protein
MTVQRSNRAATLMAARQWHSYLAAFFAPAILFFSITGALQTFNLHKPMPGYQPPAVLQALASLHKNQTLTVKTGDANGGKTPRRGKSGSAPPRVPSPASEVARTVLKIFAALVSAGLAVTTLLGLYMAWFTTRRRTVLLWFVAGLVLPLMVTLAI